MKKACLAFFSPFFSLFAALPPLAQSSREIQALVADSRIHTLLGSAEAIEEIIRTASGYVVMTKKNLLRVDVEYQSASRPGPVPFKLHFHEPVELHSEP